jgi:phage terminase small subunit
MSLPLTRLTIKQRIFISEYLKHQNATRSAMEAYPNQKYSSARVTGCRLLQNANIVKALKELLLEVGYNPKESIKRLRQTAQAGIGKDTLAKDQINADELLLDYSSISTCF